MRNLRVGEAGLRQVAGSWKQPLVPVRNPQDSSRHLCTSANSFTHFSTHPTWTNTHYEPDTQERRGPAMTRNDRGPVSVTLLGGSSYRPGSLGLRAGESLVPWHSS